LASSGVAQACIFGKLKDQVSSVVPINPSNLTVKQSDFNKIAIAGGGIATLAGLVAGSLALKTRFSKNAESNPVEVPQAELPMKESFTASKFAIVVPPEALTSSISTEEASELKKIVR
jgi:hypothetical protein